MWLHHIKKMFLIRAFINIHLCFCPQSLLKRGRIGGTSWMNVSQRGQRQHLHITCTLQWPSSNTGPHSSTISLSSFVIRQKHTLKDLAPKKRWSPRKRMRGACRSSYQDDFNQGKVTGDSFPIWMCKDGCVNVSLFGLISRHSYIYINRSIRL